MVNEMLTRASKAAATSVLKRLAFLDAFRLHRRTPVVAADDGSSPNNGHIRGCSAERRWRSQHHRLGTATKHSAR
jgi:hypothetical protein